MLSDQSRVFRSELQKCSQRFFAAGATCDLASIDESHNQYSGLAIIFALFRTIGEQRGIFDRLALILDEDCALHDPFVFRHGPIADDVMADRSVDILCITPAIGSPVLQPETTSAQIWRMPVPADCEFVER